MRGGVCCPRICELRWVVVVDIVETHAAIRAVLIFHYHRHGVEGAKREVTMRSRTSIEDLVDGPRVSEGKGLIGLCCGGKSVDVEVEVEKRK